MNISIIDYGSGNLRSASKALEAAADKINLKSKIVITSDLKTIKKSDKIVLPGQGSFRDCYMSIEKINVRIKPSISLIIVIGFPILFLIFQSINPIIDLSPLFGLKLLFL